MDETGCFLPLEASVGSPGACRRLSVWARWAGAEAAAPTPAPRSAGKRQWSPFSLLASEEGLAGLQTTLTTRQQRR